DLKFSDIFRSLATREPSATLVKSAEFFNVVAVVQRQHRSSMNEFRQAFGRPASDALSRTIGRDELRMFLFQITKPFHQLVIITIAVFAIGTLVVFELRHDIRDALIFIRPFPTHPSSLITAAGRTCLYSNHCFGSLGQSSTSGDSCFSEEAGGKRLSNLSSWFSTQSFTNSRSDFCRSESRFTCVARCIISCRRSSI